ncbi:MAG: dockerin type I repeat-containing protein [Candidatus Zixiibacteriota bacterium]
MRLRESFILLIGLLSASSSLMAQVETFPTGYNIQIEHELSRTEIHAGDTMSINRILVNHESFSLLDLYFSENLPPEPAFEVLSYELKLNGSNINCLYQMETDNPVCPGYSTYYWVIDSPLEYENLNNDINPGDSIYFSVNLVINQSGFYLLPRHTTVFYGSNSGFFSTTDSIYVNVANQCGDVNGLPPINILDITFLISYLYKGGPAPVPESAGDVNANSLINILDITYLIGYLYKGGPEPQCL